MKKLMFALVATAAVFANAEEAKDNELEQQKAPIFWGFGNYGIYSGYQLYGSLLNNEPTAQGYLEGNANLLISDLNLGYLGVGIWSNTDLTRRRSSQMSVDSNFNVIDGIGDVFNEWDFNVHWGRTFWFDDDQTWGLAYRMSVVWYYYPGKYYQNIHPACDTTWDYDHYFELINPYVTPYCNVVREYRFESNLFQAGLKKTFQVTDQLSLTPFVELVARDNRYNWCFPTRFGALGTCPGLATFKAELDSTYMITPNFGLFAKVAFCSIVDKGMRTNCDDELASDEYGENKDFAWGGVGVCFNF